MIILFIITNYGDTVKRIIISCIALLFVLNTIFSVCAAENVDFKLSNAECDINRLMDIEVIEFREAKTDNTNASIKSNETVNCVKTVYLCADGTDIRNGKTVFTITFKAIKEGTGYIDFRVYECVDKNVEFMQIDNCTSAKVTVNGSSHSNKREGSDSEKSANTSDSNKSSKGKSTRNEVTTSQSTVDNLGALNSVNDNKASYIFIGVLIGFGIVIVISFAFLFGRKTALTKSNNKK